MSTSVQNPSGLPFFSFVQRPSNRSNQTTGFADSWITAAKVERIFVKVFVTAVCSVPAIILFEVCPVALIFVPLFIFDFFGWDCGIKDYDSASDVARYKKECASLTLKEAYKRHGPFIRERALFSEERALQEYLREQNGLHSLIAVRKQFTDNVPLFESCGFRLPPPEETCKERLQKECGRLDFKEAIRLHGVDSIFSWRLYSQQDFTDQYTAYMKELFLESGLKKAGEEHGTMIRIRKTTSEEDGYSIPDPFLFLREFCLEESLRLFEKDDRFNPDRIEELIEYEIIGTEYGKELILLYHKIRPILLEKEQQRTKISIECERQLAILGETILQEVALYHEISLTGSRGRLDGKQFLRMFKEGSTFRFYQKCGLTQDQIEVMRLYENKLRLLLRKQEIDLRRVEEKFLKDRKSIESQHQTLTKNERVKK